MKHKDGENMQFYLTMRSESGTVLPLNYGHYIQSMIYRLISIGGNGDYSGFVHDEGHTDGKKQFRMFTFSKLTGKFSIKNEFVLSSLTLSGLDR